MKLAFLAAVALAVVAGSASAQYPTAYPAYGVPSTCPPGGCPRVSAAVSEVRSALAAVIAPAVQSQPVYGTWADGTAGWHVAPPASVPQTMPAASCTPTATPPRFPRVARLFGR